MDQAITALRAEPGARRSIFDEKFARRGSGAGSRLAAMVFGAIVLGGLVYAILRLLGDLSEVHEPGFPG